MQASTATSELVDEFLRFMAVAMKSSQGEVFRVVEELDLTLTQMKTLHVLDGAGRELAPSELARMIGLSPAATGRAVDGLARKGLVTRREDEADRRVKRLALSAQGQGAVDRIGAARREGLAGVLAPLTPEQRAALSAALQPLLPTTDDRCATRTETAAR